MEVKVFEKDYRSRKDVFKLHPLGDIHGGILHCDEKAIKARIKDIAEDPFALWIGMGDYAEFIDPRDNRWDPEITSPWVQQGNVISSQRKWVTKLFRPIVDKCVGLIEGNHEEKIRKRTFNDVYMDICEDLGVTPLGYSCFVDFKFRRTPRGKEGGSVTSFVGHFKHGSGGGTTKGWKINTLLRGVKDFPECSIYAMGHLHDIITDKDTPLHMTAHGHLGQKMKAVAMTGCWVQTYKEGVRPSYAEAKGYSPSPIDAPIFYITPDKGIVSVAWATEITAGSKD